MTSISGVGATPGDYLVDQRGWRFDQVAKIGEPIPDWGFTEKLSNEAVRKLVAHHLLQEEPLYRIPDLHKSVPELIELVFELDR